MPEAPGSPRSTREAVSAYLSHRHNTRANPTTTAAYGTDLHYLVGYLGGDTPLRRITPLSNAGFDTARMEAGDRPLTARRRFATATVWQRWCADRGWCPPPQARTALPTRGHPPRTLRPRDIGRLFTTPGVYPHARRRDEAILRVMYQAAANVVELVALDLDDWEPAKRRLWVGESRRAVVLDKAATAALNACIKERRPFDPDEPAIFLNLHGFPLSRQGVYAVVTVARRAAGLPAGVTPQAVRVSRAVLLAAEFGRKDLATRTGRSGNALSRYLAAARN